MPSLLFVCHGNICRSPMAQSIFAELARRAGLDERFLVDSAAVSTEEIGSGIYPPAAAELARRHIPCAAHRARLFLPFDALRFDLLIGMEHRHLRQMQRIAPAAAQPKLRLLGFWAGGGEIADPWYTGDFVCAADEIEAGCQGLLDELQRGLR